MSIHYQDATVTLYAGDCLDVLRELPDCSVDSVVTDPPYNLTAGKRGGTGAASVNLDSPYGRSRIGTGNGGGGFMGKGWDDYDSFVSEDGSIRGFQAWCLAWTAECLRVLKPGGHLLAFGGTRTWHRLACAVEDAGFEMRDSIAWLYGSGFPKSLNVSNAIRGGMDEPETPESQQWQGWGTALKPAFEPIVVARKPLGGTVAQNVTKWGTGALNIDGCRIAHGTDVDLTREQRQRSETSLMGGLGNGHKAGHVQPLYAPGGRWPANVVLDEHQAEALDQQSGEQRDGVAVQRNGGGQRIGNTVYSGSGGGVANPDQGYGAGGGASRFFYTAKAGADERITHDGIAHPTVKPLALMRWLVRLVTPPGGTVLEPFAGSGTTVEACILEGFRCVAVEREADYLPLIVQRINRRRDPVAYITAAGGDLGLFDDLESA